MSERRRGDMRHRWLPVVVLALAVAGCAPSESESREDVAEMRDLVDDEVARATEVLASAGFEVVEDEDGGSFATCGLRTVTIEYTDGFRVEGEDDLEAQIFRASEVLQADAGWEPEAEDSTPEPYSNVVKGDLRLGILESRRHPGTVSFGVRHPCIDAAESVIDETISEQVSGGGG